MKFPEMTGVEKMRIALCFYDHRQRLCSQGFAQYGHLALSAAATELGLDWHVVAWARCTLTADDRRAWSEAWREEQAKETPRD